MFFKKKSKSKLGLKGKILFVPRNKWEDHYFGLPIWYIYDQSCVIYKYWPKGVLLFEYESDARVHMFNICFFTAKKELQNGK